MRRNLYVLLILLVLFWIEAGFRKVFPGSHLVPQFLLITVVAFSVTQNFHEAVFASFIGGFMAELFSGLYFGTVVFAMLLVVIINYFLVYTVSFKTLFISRGWLLLCLATVVLPFCAYVYNLTVSGLNLAGQPELKSFYSWTLLWQVVSNLTVFFPLQKIINRAFNE